MPAPLDKSVLYEDATAQATHIRRGDYTPLELTDTVIDAIERLNPVLNAVITPMFDLARQAAQGDIPDGVFKGVPFLLKDLMAMYKGVPSSLGSGLLRHFTGDHDDELTLRYRQAGLIIVGKTNLPEFGILPTTEPVAFGASKNPWNIAHTTGGSSGGSAAAVAARIVAMAHANDGGGSIRIPAACCGLFGMKPTRGRNPVGPYFTELSSGLVAEHALTRSVRDSAALLDITGQPALGDPYHAPAKVRPYAEEIKHKPHRLRIGYTYQTMLGTPVDAEAQNALKAAIGLCRDLGHDLVEAPPIALSYPSEQIMQAFTVIWAAGITTPIGLMERMGFAQAKEMVEPLSRAFYEIAKTATALDYELSRLVMQRIARELSAYAAQLDVMLTPVLAEPPLVLGTLAQDPSNPMATFERAAQFAPYTALQNITGQPACAVPLYWTAAGLPLGVQFVGQFGDEATLFRLAAQLEEAQPWADKLPEVLA